MQFGTQGMTIAGAKVGHLAHLFGKYITTISAFLVADWMHLVIVTYQCFAR
jgi:hypothetical protein